MTDKQQKANIVCCETCSHREVCYDVITNTDYDFKGYGCLRYCVSPLVIRNNVCKETAKEVLENIKTLVEWGWEMSRIEKWICKNYGVEVEE